MWMFFFIENMLGSIAKMQSAGYEFSEVRTMIKVFKYLLNQAVVSLCMLLIILVRFKCS